MFYNKITIGKAEHEVDNNRCQECWSSFPKNCECSGLVHAEFIKESWDRVLTLLFVCDKCGPNYKEKIKERKYVKRQGFRHKPIYRKNKSS